MMTTTQCFNFQVIDPSWHDCIKAALQKMDPAYLDTLYHEDHWLPGPDLIFNAFSQPKDKVHYVLFGESPYPRATSANGFAFWDAAVKNLWSTSGLSKEVNRATSLRNIIKTLLVAEGLLPPHQTDQASIAAIDKNHLIQTNEDLFRSLLRHGFLLLNATPVLRPNNVRKDALAWQPFVKYILEDLFQTRPDVELILLGNIANTIDKLITHHPIKKRYAEHPYNLSFINNPEMIAFFKPMQLLLKT